MAEYRSVPETDLNEFHRLISYAFRPTEEFEPIESRKDIPEPETVGEGRGLYDGDELVCTGVHYWFTLQIRSEDHQVAGLGGVSTPPKHRRKGHVRQLLADSLKEYRERDQCFAALWPFSYSFYRRFGWGMCSEEESITCPPDALAFLDSVNMPSGGEYVDLDADYWGELDQVYEACNDHGLAMRRTEEWWRKRIFHGWNDPYVSGWERDGELRGYLVYDIEDEDDGRTMTIHDLGYVDPEAYTELLRFCYYHDSQVERVVIPDASTMLHDFVEDPRAVEIERQPGAMIRVVDVERALSHLSYPADGSVVLDVNDRLAEWNDGRFRLTVADGTATCEPTTDDPDATVGVATLSQIAVGYLSVEHATVTGDLTVSEPRTLSALFPEEETYLREGF